MNNSTTRWHLPRKLFGRTEALTALVAALAIMLCAPVLAQENEGTPLRAVSEWKGEAGPQGANIAVSADGLHMAHLGPSAFNDGLYVKDLSSGEDKLILKDAHGLGVYSSLSFSPDGTRLLFAAGGGTRYYKTGIYAIGVDGTNLIELAENIDVTVDRSDKSGKTHYSVSIGKPLYSPDGSKILIELRTESGGLDQNAKVKLEGERTYAALLSPGGRKQIPKRLIEGQPLFWSSDGTGIYYSRMSNDGTAINSFRFDLVSQQSIAVANASDFFKVPGDDAVLAPNADRTSLKAVRLDGAAVSPALAGLAASIPLTDADGRNLQAIDSGGPQQLLLSYAGPVTSPRVSTEPLHAEIVSIE